MNKDIKKRLITNQSLSNGDIYTIALKHLELFGTMGGYGSGIDRVAIQYLVDRVKAFYNKDSKILETVAKYKTQLQFKPTRDYTQIKPLDVMTLTEVEQYNLKEDYIKEFSDAEKLNRYSFKDNITMLDRLQKLKAGNEMTIEFRNQLKEIK